MSRLIELLPSPEIDESLLASERLENLRGTMLVDGLDVLVLTNPVSIRYATGYRVQSSMQSRIPTVYAIVPIVGPIITAFVGTFLGAGLVTLWETRSMAQSTRVGFGLLLARTVAIGLKVAVAVTLIAAVAVSLLL